MRHQVNITLDLTSTTGDRSVSREVEAPAWAVYVNIYPDVLDWGTGPGATVTLEEAAAGQARFHGLATPVTFTSNTPARDKPIRASRLRLRTTTAAGAGPPAADSEALFAVIFTDRIE